MSIKFDPDTLTATTDIKTYQQLLHGTEFQQSLALLTMMSNYIESLQKEALGNVNLTPKEHQQLLKNLAHEREMFIRLNPPPGIDPDALIAHVRICAGIGGGARLTWSKRQ